MLLGTLKSNFVSYLTLKSNFVSYLTLKSNFVYRIWNAGIGVIAQQEEKQPGRHPLCQKLDTLGESEVTTSGEQKPPVVFSMVECLSLTCCRKLQIKKKNQPINLISYEQV